MCGVRVSTAFSPRERPLCRSADEYPMNTRGSAPDRPRRHANPPNAPRDRASPRCRAGIPRTRLQGIGAGRLPGKATPPRRCPVSFLDSPRVRLVRESEPPKAWARQPARAAAWLGRAMSGWTNHYAVRGSGQYLERFTHSRRRLLFRALRRRPQRDRTEWEDINPRTAPTGPRPESVIHEPTSRRQGSREEPGALTRTPGSVRGNRGNPAPYRDKLSRIWQ